MIAGAGSNNTYEAIELTKYAESVGAQAVLSVSPYFNRPSQNGIYNHFKAIANNTSIDVILYNIPVRTNSNIDIETTIELSKISNIKGIKEGGSIQQIIDLSHEFFGSDFSVLTGEDTLLLSCCAAGGDGGVLAAANVCPSKIIDLYNAAISNHFDKALEIDRTIRPLVKTLFYESNPVVVKYAISKIFDISSEVRLPLISPSDKTINSLMDAMNLAGVYPENTVK